MKITAYYLEKKINLRTLQRKFQAQIVLADPLVIQRKHDQYAAILRYGVIIFWGFTAQEEEKFLQEHLSQKSLPKKRITETLEVEINDQKTEELVEDNKLILSELSPEKIGLASLVIGRSVALEYYEKLTEKVYSEFDPLIAELKTKGKTVFFRKTLLKKVGAAMEIRHITFNQITLLDKPEVTWEDENLYKLYHKLLNEFDIEDRYKILNQRLDYVYRDIEFTLQLLEGRNNFWLELTIVLLIVFEIIQTFVGN